jgi:hypothetical protein
LGEVGNVGVEVIRVADFPMAKEQGKECLVDEWW